MYEKIRNKSGLYRVIFILLLIVLLLLAVLSITACEGDRTDSVSQGQKSDTLHPADADAAGDPGNAEKDHAETDLPDNAAGHGNKAPEEDDQGDRVTDKNGNTTDDKAADHEKDRNDNNGESNAGEPEDDGTAADSNPEDAVDNDSGLAPVNDEDSAGDELLEPGYDGAGNQGEPWEYEVFPWDGIISARYWLGEEGEKTVEYGININKKGQKDLLNEEGEIILSGYEEYDLMLNFILAKKDGKWGLYDGKGEKIIDHIYEEIANYEMPNDYKPNGLVGVKTKGLWGALDQGGNVVLQPEYEYIELNYYEEGEPFIKVKKSGKYGYVTRDGKSLVDTVWDNAFMDVLNVEEDIIFVQQGGRWGGIKVKDNIAALVDWKLLPSQEAQLSFNNWLYPCQQEFYINIIRDGKTQIFSATRIFINEYFRENPSRIRSLPEFQRGESPDWDELTKFVYENTEHDSDDISITKEDFAETVTRFFGDLAYSDDSSAFLEFKEGKYTPKGWSDHGFYIYELTGIEKDQMLKGQYMWKAHITGYYFHETDGDPQDSSPSPNAQAVYKEMKKMEYYGLNFWQACDHLAWNNPGAVLEPAGEWLVEFTVNDPLGDISFTYLSCEKNGFNH